MPIGTCDPASRGEAHNELAMAVANGQVLLSGLWDWDGVSVRPNCDGPIVSLRTRNISQNTWWATLPNKKKAPLWVQLDPGTDVTITQKGQLNNLGIVNYTDLFGIEFVQTQPT